jgi:hypothetical protein
MPTPSIFRIGHPLEDDARLTGALGGPPARFFTLAQRISWGVTQADLVRVDVPAACRAVVDEYPVCPASHLLEAFAALARGDREVANAARARALVLADGHALAWLCPTDAEWSGQEPEQRLTEVVPGRIWRTRAWFTMNGTKLRGASDATLVRTESGELAFLNAVALGGPTAERIRALGEVRWVTTGSKVHSTHVPSLRALFPKARSIGVAGHRTHPASAHLAFDGVLGEPDLLPEEFDVVLLAGTELADAQIFHRPTRTLVSTHLAGANLLAHKDEGDFAGRLYRFSFGLLDDVGWMAYQPILWSNLGALQSRLRTMLAWDVERIACDHTEAVLEGETKDRLRATLDWVVKLPPGTHLSLLARTFWHQPGFLADLVRYKLR